MSPVFQVRRSRKKQLGWCVLAFFFFALTLYTGKAAWDTKICSGALCSANKIFVIAILSFLTFVFARGAWVRIRSSGK